MVHQFKFLLMKVTNQPIISQELHVVKHVIMIKMPCWSSNWTTEWEKKGDLSDLNVAWLLVPDVLVWVFQKQL